MPHQQRSTKRSQASSGHGFGAVPQCDAVGIADDKGVFAGGMNRHSQRHDRITDRGIVGKREGFLSEEDAVPRSRVRPPATATTPLVDPMRTASSVGDGARLRRPPPSRGRRRRSERPRPRPALAQQWLLARPVSGAIRRADSSTLWGRRSASRSESSSGSGRRGRSTGGSEDLAAAAITGSGSSRKANSPACSWRSRIRTSSWSSIDRRSRHCRAPFAATHRRAPDSHRGIGPATTTSPCRDLSRQGSRLVDRPDVRASSPSQIGYQMRSATSAADPSNWWIRSRSRSEPGLRSPRP